MLAFLQGNPVPKIPLQDWTESFVDFVKENDALDTVFGGVKGVITLIVSALETALTAPPEMVMIVILAAIAFLLTNRRATASSVGGFVLGSLLLVGFPLWGPVALALAESLNVPQWLVTIPVFVAIAALFFGSPVAVFTVLGFLLILSLGLWQQAMLTLALVLAATLVSLVLGVPIGILAAKSRVVEAPVRPTLDVMQTMPSLVYLVPMVVLLGLRSPPALVATVVFASPPAVRLTMLGIQQVPKNTVEAAQAFGATSWQTLRKVELPQALPTIMAGVNQVIMLALSMTVVAALAGGGGLGEGVVQGLSQLNVGRAFVGGVGIVIIAIYLDRVTRRLGRATQGKGGFSKILPRTKFLPGRKAEPDTAGATGAGAEDVGPPETDGGAPLPPPEERPVTRGSEERGGAAEK